MRPDKTLEEPTPASFVNKSKTRPSPTIDPNPIRENNPEGASSSIRPPEQEIDFAELENGTLVEMVEDPNNPANSVFAIRKNGKVEIAAKLECENRVLVPFPRDQGIFKHVRLPRGLQPPVPPSVLLGRIELLILDCVDMSQGNAFLAAAFALSTWFIECLPVAPYLALVGLPRSGKTTLLQVLNLVCRRPLLTADITSAGFYEAYEKLNPTLIVDETLTTVNRRELFHLLKTGTTRGSITLRKGRSLKAFGPKVISCTELPNDVALNSRCVIIPMQESNRTDLKKPSDKRILQDADVLQQQLLRFRLENFKSLRLPKIEGDDSLYSRTRDLYQALALPIAGDAGVCRYLVQLLTIQQEINREPLSPASAAVLQALYEFILSHREEGKLANKELTICVNMRLDSLQENFRLSAHEVGRILTSLGLTNRKRTSAGFILWLDRETREYIHKMAHNYGIDQES